LRDRFPEAIRALILDDLRVCNDSCWSVFDCGERVGRQGGRYGPLADACEQRRQVCLLNVDVRTASNPLSALTDSAIPVSGLMVSVVRSETGHVGDGT
jgi:hypothetical protein